MPAKFLRTVEFVATFCFFFGYLLSCFHQLLMTRSFATRNGLLIKALVHRNAHAIDLESCLSEFEAVSMDAV